MFAEYFYAFRCEFIIGDVELFDIEMIEEHLFQSLISDVVIYKIQVLEPRVEILGYIKQYIVIDVATIQFQMYQFGVGPQKVDYQ